MLRTERKECTSCGEVRSCNGPYCDAANDEIWLCNPCKRDLREQGADV